MVVGKVEVGGEKKVVDKVEGMDSEECISEAAEGCKLGEEVHIANKLNISRRDRKLTGSFFIYHSFFYFYKLNLFYIIL